MGVLVALSVGLVFWIVAWSLGAKSFDAFLVTVALVMVATTARLAAPFVNQLLGRQTAPPTERGIERS